jgi:hypothetical protein
MMRTALKPPVDNGNIVPLGNLKYMPKFYKWIKNQPLNEILTLSLNKIDIAVSYQRGTMLPLSTGGFNAVLIIRMLRGFTSLCS